MTLRRLALILVVMAASAAVGWMLSVGVSRWTRPASSGRTATVAPAQPAQPGRRIKARLFYVAEDGARLTAVEREVPYAESAIEQAKEIVNAQMAPVVEPLVSAVPPGTTLRALFVTGDGQAYVDLSSELSRAHPGGSLNELLTIYTLVDVLTANLPAVNAVQILIDGKAVDTLAGHVDLRRPLMKNLDLVE